MKRFVLSVLLLASFASVCLAGDYMLWGVPMATKTVYVDNVARTFQSLYERGGGTWASADGTGAVTVPFGVFITCATTDTHWGFGGTAPTTAVGHYFPAGSSWNLLGGDFISSGKGIGAGATDNVTCQMTPQRQK